MTASSLRSGLLRLMPRESRNSRRRRPKAEPLPRRQQSAPASLPFQRRVSAALRSRNMRASLEALLGKLACCKRGLVRVLNIRIEPQPKNSFNFNFKFLDLKSMSCLQRRVTPFLEVRSVCLARWLLAASKATLQAATRTSHAFPLDLKQK